MVTSLIFTTIATAAVSSCGWCWQPGLLVSLLSRAIGGTYILALLVSVIVQYTHGWPPGDTLWMRAADALSPRRVLGISLAVLGQLNLVVHAHLYLSWTLAYSHATTWRKTKAKTKTKTKSKSKIATTSSSSHRHNNGGAHDAEGHLTSTNVLHSSNSNSNSIILHMEKNVPFGDSGLGLDVYPATIFSSSSSSSSSSTETLPQSSSCQASPVLIFVYGGAWMSGRKSMYCLWGRRFARLGYTVIIPDYTLHPQGGSCDTMLADLHACCMWVRNNVSHYGGDPDRIWLCGHSAGAHLASLLTLKLCAYLASENAATAAAVDTTAEVAITPPPYPAAAVQSDVVSDEKHIETTSTAWLNNTSYLETRNLIRALRLVVGLSGVYDIAAHFEHEAWRGVEHISAMARVMGGVQHTFQACSPTCLARSMSQSNICNSSSSGNVDQHSSTTSSCKDGESSMVLPMPFLLLHGVNDGTVPHGASETFATALQQCGASVTLHLLPCSHADVVLAPMRRCEPFHNEVMKPLQAALAKSFPELQ